jgi:hypothetical protein
MEELFKRIEVDVYKMECILDLLSMLICRKCRRFLQRQTIKG